MSRKLKALRFAPVLALVVLAISAAPAAAECTPTNRVCVTATSEPSSTSVPSQTAGSDAYLRYSVLVTNNGPNTINHAFLTSELIAGANEATPGAFCSDSGPTPGCTGGNPRTYGIGSLAAGASVSFTVVVRAPALADPTKVDQFTNKFTVAFEVTNTNDSGGKVNTIPTSAVVTLSGGAGTTFVPSSAFGVASVALTTSPTGSKVPDQSDKQIGRVSIPTLTAGFVPSLTEPTIGTPGDCTVFIGSDGKKHYCHGGGWFQATVPLYPSPNTGKFLTFDLYWDGSLAAPVVTASTFEVFHANNAADPPSTWEILTSKQLCTSANDPGPCFEGKPDVNASGDWHARIHRPGNGYSRW